MSTHPVAVYFWTGEKQSAWPACSVGAEELSLLLVLVFDAWPQMEVRVKRIAAVVAGLSAILHALRISGLCSRESSGCCYKVAVGLPASSVLGG